MLRAEEVSMGAAASSSSRTAAEVEEKSELVSPPPALFEFYDETGASPRTLFLCNLAVFVFDARLRSLANPVSVEFPPLVSLLRLCLCATPSPSLCSPRVRLGRHSPL